MPTQVRYPWRATLRTVIVVAISLLPVLPDIARSAGISTVPAVVCVLTAAAAVQRVIAIPQVDRLFRQYFGVATAPASDPNAQNLDRMIEDDDPNRTI
ncbi:hypothetical protein [uncultured Corynebacterium sp.]|uniref:hypothetical protein n=1 Tax=uncultured Corynebacterium sp. TaxID=159447 RepID=UPI0025D3B972|nr:hypothetical protein [uncultured Corynebacterium sp.]